MTLADEFVGLANDYISGRIKLGVLDVFIHDHVDQSVELDKTNRPDALLLGFVQVRIYEMDHGLTEDSIRRDVAAYLAEHELLQPAAKQRATG